MVQIPDSTRLSKAILYPQQPLTWLERLKASGGPLSAASPYNTASDNVGVVDTTIRALYSSSNLPVTGGRASILIKAKPSNLTPASNDYTDTLTLIASGSF